MNIYDQEEQQFDRQRTELNVVQDVLLYELDAFAFFISYLSY